METTGSISQAIHFVITHMIAYNSFHCFLSLSFFRQLDFILSTVSNEEFRKLYNISDVEIYAKLKKSLFMRFLSKYVYIYLPTLL